MRITRLLGINSPTIAVITRRNYPSHPITEGYALSTFFPKSAAFKLRNESDWSARPLLQTGDLSWLETGALGGEVEFDEAADTKGPLITGLSLQRKPVADGPEQRVVIIGDGDFLSNSYHNSGGNSEFGLRLFTWLAGDDSHLAITGPVRTDTELAMQNTTLGIFGVLYLLLIPAGLFITGMMIWWRRKRL